MMTILEIGEPEVLAKLPRTACEVGRLHISQVIGLKDGVTRKRRELCAAVDGDSASIIDVHRAKTISSYSIPPDSTFSCPPLSIRIKTQSGEVLRRTYCVTRRRHLSSLQVFGQSEEHNTNTLNSPKILLSEKQSLVLSIHRLPSSNEIVVLHENGCYEVISSELDKSICCGVLTSDRADAKYVAFKGLSISEAAKSILKRRPDITNLVSPNTLLVYGVFRTHLVSVSEPRATTFGIWSITPGSNAVQQLSPIICHDIPINAQFELRSRDPVAFNSKGSKLTLRSLTRSISFDITQPTPKQTSELSFQSGEHISVIDISETLTLSSTPSSIYLYNTTFRTTQATCDISKSNVKRKRSQQPSGPLYFVGYIAQLKRVLAVRRNYLMAIDLRFPQSADASAGFKSIAMLANNIGRSLNNVHRPGPQEQRKIPSLGVSTKQGNLHAEWVSTVRRLEEAAESKSEEAFERIFLDHAGEMQNEQATTTPAIPDYRVAYVLSKIFQSPDHPKDDTILKAEHFTIKFLPRNLFLWLSKGGHLTARKIMDAIAPFPHTMFSSVDNIIVIKALIAHDPSLSLLQSYIKLMPHLEIAALCSTVNILINMALSQTAPPVQASSEGTLVGIEQTTPLAIIPQNRHESIPSQIASPLTATLKRLAHGDLSKLSNCLRSSLNKPDLIALIQYLRQQLFSSGYTRSIANKIYPSPPSSQNELELYDENVDEAHAQLSLWAISVLLGGCLDAIGPLGMLNSGETNDFVETVVTELSSEVARAADALEDSIYLQGILREFIRFSSTVPEKYPVSSTNKVGDSGIPRPGTIQTIHSESAEDGGISCRTTLPLSLRAHEKINIHKVRKGGGQIIERSRREIGALQDRLRGPYSLERLIL